MPFLFAPPLQILIPRITHFSSLSHPRTFSMEMSLSVRGVRRFAPLKETDGTAHTVPRLKGVVFDVDGTLW
jgi:hypothetical protein